jgi:hypothetical protein
MDLHHRLQGAYVTLGLEPMETVAVLGHDSIDSSLSVDRIKAAFRKMALEHHPDKIVHHRSIRTSDDADKTGNTDFHFCAVHSAYKFLLAHHERQHINNNSRKEGRGAALSQSTSRRNVAVQHRMDSLQRRWDDDSTKLRRSIHAQSLLEQQRADRISLKSSRVINQFKASCLTSGKGTSAKASHGRSTSVPLQTTLSASAAKADAQLERHATSSSASASLPAADTAPGIAASNSCCSTFAAAPLPAAATMASMAPCCLPHGTALLSLSADRRVAMHVLLLQESKLRLQATQCERTFWESIVTAGTIQ